MDELIENAVNASETAAAGAVQSIQTVQASNAVQATQAVPSGQEVVKEIATQTKDLFYFDELSSYFTWGTLAKLVISILTLLIFFFVFRLIKKLVNKQSGQKIKEETAHTINKVLNYVFQALLVMFVLSFLGVDLTGIWGAAGIVGVALGFAAQTSVSNLISGLFVLGEKAVKVGDYIEVDEVSGTIDSIGLLSIRIHTLDNQMIRIPNGTIITSNLKNYSTFKTRRFVMEVSVKYEYDFQKVLDIVSEIPAKCEHVNSKPAPKVYYDGYGDKGARLMIAVWLKSSDFDQVKNELYIAVHEALKQNGIEIPYMYLGGKGL